MIKTREAYPSISNPPATTASSDRTRSLTAGILYVLTFVSIPTLFLYNPVKGANYIIATGSDNRAIIGGILEIIVALAGIGTAVVLFPILKKQDESAALGLRRRPGSGIGDDLCRRGVPFVDRHPAEIRTRSRRIGHGSCAGRPL